MKHGLVPKSGNFCMAGIQPLKWVGIFAIILMTFTTSKAADVFCPIQPNTANVAATCFQGTDGSASVNPDGGTAPYTINWSNGGSGNSINGLSPGHYQYTITDAADCSVNGNIYVGQASSIQANITRINNGCRFDMNGELTLNPSGGTPPYSYSWNTGASTATISDLAAGAYSYTITDAAGCTKAGGISVLANTPVLGNASVRNVVCYGEEEGSAFLEPTGGVAPYTFAWSNGATTQNIGDLGAGSYSYTVTDSEGCTGSGDLAIQQPAPVWTTFEQRYACFGEDNGYAEVFANGGTPPYTYQWSNGATTAAIHNLAPGMYFYTVTDSEGCESSEGLVCIFRSLVDASVTASAPDCSSANDGSASLIVTDGLPPINYLWSNGATTASINNLAPGTYGYTVTDAGGCDVTGEVTIAGGIEVVASVVEVAGGNLQASGIGGTPPYTYNWSNGETTAIASGYVDGTYSVTVTDVNGCFGIISGLVPENEPCTDNVTYPGMIGHDQYLCAPGNTPAPIVETDPPSGGSGTLEYLWMQNSVGGPYDPNFWYPIPNSNSPNYSPGPLDETTYFIRCVRRAEEGCVFLETTLVQITVGDEIEPIIEHPGLGCFGETQTYSVSGLGILADVNWAFDGPVTVNTTVGNEVEVTFIGGGYLNYSVTITDDGCTGTYTGRVTINGNCFDTEDATQGIQSSNISSYPNPVQDRTTLQLKEKLDYDAEVYLYNSTHQLQAVFTLPAGTTLLDLDLSNYSTGLYMIRMLDHKGQPQLTKLIKN